MGWLGQMVFSDSGSWIATDYHNGWTSLQSHRQCQTVPLSPHPLCTCFPDFNDCHSNWCEVISHGGFDLHFTWWPVMVSILSCVFGCINVFLREVSVLVLTHFWWGCFFPSKFVWVHCRCRIALTMRWIGCKNFLHFVGCLFTLMVVSSAVQKLFS